MSAINKAETTGGAGICSRGERGPVLKDPGSPSKGNPKNQRERLPS